MTRAMEPSVQVFARFSEDMAETLLQYFEHYADDGVVSIEVNCRGLWLVNPNNETRQFLGKALQGVEPCDGPASYPTHAMYNQ